MPHHKFILDLENLENNPLVGHYHLLVVGTFNPEIANNEAGWFYGRKENEFWCLLPRMMNEPTLHPVDRDEPYEELIEMWKQYCVNNQIIIVDIFKTVFPRINDFNDNNLQNLAEDEYDLFNFQTAFASASFDAVLFTWKGMANNTLTNIKNQYINFFEPQGSALIHLLTPSMAYPKSRAFKLAQWRTEYENI